MLRDANDLLEFIKQTSLCTWRVADDGYVMNLPGWLSLTGQTAEEVVGEGWMDVVHPDDVERTRMAWRTAVAHGSPYNTDYRVRCADGIYRWVNSRGVPILLPDGRTSHWVGVVLAVSGVMRPSLAEAGSRTGQFTQISPPALRAARAMLNWSSERMASEAGVSLSTIRRLELDGTSPDGFRRSSIEKVIRAIIDTRLRLTGSAPIATGVEAVDDWRPPKSSTMSSAD